MLYIEDKYNLTQQEMERALRDAGISRPFWQWTPADTSYAEFILSKAQDAKINKLKGEHDNR